MATLSVVLHKVNIGGKFYGVEKIEGVGQIGYRLTSPNGDHYYVTIGERVTCDCRDFTYRHAHTSDGKCKHIRALAIAGKLDNAPVTFHAADFVRHEAARYRTSPGGGLGRRMAEALEAVASSLDDESRF